VITTRPGHTQQMHPAARRVADRVRTVVRKRGFDVVRYRPGLASYIDADAATTIGRVRRHTMTGDDSLFSLIQSVRYVERHKVPGSIVECGVWRGGSMMAAAITLQQLGNTDRDLYLYDTFEGMTLPTSADVMLHGDQSAADLLTATERGDGANVWCVADLPDVQRAVGSIGYPAQRCHYVVGDVAVTLPEQPPEGPIALLRLDTDWYDSTRQELEHLVPRISPGGVLIIDDYWHWGGCRKAVDEYLAATGLPIMLTRVDITAVGVVPA
jgi:O-methyltransferase